MLASSSSPAANAVHALARPIAGGRMLTPSRLQHAMETTYGAPAASGRWSWRDAYDTVEAAFLTHVPTLIADNDGDAACLAALTAALAKLPTQTRRSEEQIRLQQFSTPAPYAFIAARAAALGSGDAVMEPSAGIGALAMFAKLEGALRIVNEIDPARRSLLELVIGRQAHGYDAELIDDLLPPELEPTVVLMNPPFSSSAPV